MRPFFLTSLALASVLWACGGPPPPPGPFPITEVHLVPRNEIVLSEGNTRALSVTVLDSSWTARTVPVLWSSDMDTVASVSDSGVVTAVRAGTARITARVRDRSDSVTVKVVPPMTVEIVQSSHVSGTATECEYVLVATPRDGAPGDSATWGASQIVFHDTTGVRSVVERSDTAMLDLFGSSVIYSGGPPLTSHREVATPATKNLTYQIRYNVDTIPNSERVDVQCPGQRPDVVE